MTAEGNGAPGSAVTQALGHPVSSPVGTGTTTQTATTQIITDAHRDL